MESGAHASVFLVWHVHHVATPACGGPAHVESFDDFWADEEEGDDGKLLGAYSSRQKAIDRIERAVSLPGSVWNRGAFTSASTR